MDYHVGGLLQHFLGFRGNGYAPRRIFRSDYFAEIAPDFRWVVIDRADNFNGLFFPHQPRNRCADWAHTILDGANFLFHVALRFPFACAHNAQFGFKGNPYDNGIPARIQRRTAPSVERRVARASGAGIVAGAERAPHNGWRERQPILEEWKMPAKKLSDAELTALLHKARAWNSQNHTLSR